MPSGFQGSQFGPDLRLLVIMLYLGLCSTENKIEKFLKYLGISISAGEISRILMKVPTKMTWSYGKKGRSLKNVIMYLVQCHK